MKEEDKARKELLGELSDMRRKIADLRESEIELRRAEEALRESEERYRIAIEHSNDGVAIVKGDQHIYVNRKFLDMFGYDRPEEIVGKDVFFSVHPDDREKVIAINRGRQKGDLVPSRYEFKGIRKDGNPIYIEVSATRIVYKGESNTLAYLRDITERRRNEEEMHQARKMQAMGTLAGGIAHDFNNILAAIIGFSERALREIKGDEDPLKRYVELIRKSGMRGRDLVRQILTFSRKTTPRQEPARLGPLVEETSALLRATLPATVQMETLVDTQSDEIFADFSQIQQVLLNLASNGAQSMREKGGILKITVTNVILDEGNPALHPNMTPGEYVALIVSDTGSGMSNEVQERIFDPFFTTKPVGEGIGMGLSVVYGIVQIHKGAITVSSEPGKGSTFSVFFPRARQKEKLPKETPETVPGGTERILFVDDEELLVEMTGSLLEGIGYHVTATTDCREALKIFSENPESFDLVIVDEAMPYMTGSDLAKEMMKLRRDIPVILCTGYSELISEEDVKAMGVKELVLKPLTRQETAEIVRRVLDNRDT